MTTELELENRVLKKLLQELMAKPDSKAVPTEDSNKDVDWTKIQTKCSLCGHEGPVVPDFGLRRTPRAVYKQSRCKNCRSKENYRYYNQPRKYKKRTT